MRLVVSGYYGFGNAGDEAVLAGMLRAFAQAGVERSAFTALSADPQATEQDHGVRAVPRMDMGQVRRAIHDASALISGGGSLFQDATSLRSVVYYAWILRMAHRLGKPVVVYAQGIGPLRRRTSRWLVRRVIGPAAYVSVRDERSRDLLVQIGVARDDIHVTSDPAFALEQPSREEGLSLLRRAGADVSRPVVGLAPRPWANADVASLVSSLARSLMARGYGVALMPMQAVQDRPLCDPCPVGASVLSENFAGNVTACAAMEAVVAMRLHALIFGAMGGAALVGIAYDPKVHAFMETLGQSDYVTGLNEARSELVSDAVERAMADAASRERLSAAVERLRTEAYANAERVVRHLGVSA